MKYLKYTLCVALLFMIGVACEVQSDEFPIDFEEMIEPDNTGGFLRVVSVEQGAWDLLNLGEAAFIFTAEVDDAENGGQFEKLDFFVGFTDNNDPAGSLAETSSPILTVDASAFSVNEESGLPRSEINIPANLALDALGLQESDLEDFDTFNFRWEMTLTNGQVVTAENSGQNVRGGAFFNSPFERRVLVGKLVPEDQFVGTYTMERTAGSGIFGDIFFVGGTGEIELEVDPDNSINGRQFVAPYLPQFGFGDRTWKIILVRLDGAPNEVIFPEQSGGLSCVGGPGLFIGMQDGLTPGTFTVGSDGSFNMNVTENTRSGCGAGPSDAFYSLTKN